VEKNQKLIGKLDSNISYIPSIKNDNTVIGDIAGKNELFNNYFSSQPNLSLNQNHSQIKM